MAREKQRLKEDLEQQIKLLKESSSQSEQEREARYAASLEETRSKFESDLDLEKRRAEELLSSTKKVSKAQDYYHSN